MKVVYVTKKSKVPLNKCVLSLGIFDGLHLGHQFIIKRAIAKAASDKLISAALTFDPHPANILLYPHQPVKMLSTLSQRLELLKELGVDIAYVVRFNKRFANLSAEEFAQQILFSKIRPQTIIVGEDFRFGKDASGDKRYLATLAFSHGCSLEVVASQKKKGRVISSSLIRQLLNKGDVQQANKFLGRPYTVEGEVIKGRSLGKRLGFPTVNVGYDPSLVLPVGIFSGLVCFKGKRYRAAIYCGFRPTLKRRLTRASLEAHIFGFKKNIYGHKVRILFLKKIRQDKRFNTLAQLRQAIRRDLTFLKQS